MDKQLRAEIVATVNRSVKVAMECYQERWLTDVEMSQYVSVMTKRWLRDHGHLLPRTQVEHKDKNGRRHATSFIYPLHRILAMIDDGRIKQLNEISSNRKPSGSGLNP
jgi:hypothetical protein